MNNGRGISATGFNAANLFLILPFSQEQTSVGLQDQVIQHTSIIMEHDASKKQPATSRELVDVGDENILCKYMFF